jgi:hypothetical protein
MGGSARMSIILSYLPPVSQRLGCVRGLELEHPCALEGLRWCAHGRQDAPIGRDVTGSADGPRTQNDSGDSQLHPHPDDGFESPGVGLIWSGDDGHERQVLVGVSCAEVVQGMGASRFEKAPTAGYLGLGYR